MVGVAYHPVGHRARPYQRFLVAVDDRMRHDVVALGLDEQDVAAVGLAGAQRAIVRRRHEAPAIGAEVLVLAQLHLGRLPAAVHVERRHPQRQPAHRPAGGKDGGQVAAVAAAHHGDRRRVDAALAHQRVIGRQHIGQVVLARYGFLHRQRIGVAGQVEGQADAAQRGDFAGAGDVLFLAAAPAMHEQHAGRERGWTDQGAGNVTALGMDRHFLFMGGHGAGSSCTW